MKKVNLGKKEAATIYLDDLRMTDHIGFIADDGSKGYLAYLGDFTGEKYRLSAINSREIGFGPCNYSYGYLCDNSSTSVKEALNLKCGIKASEVFVFDTRKELYRWLSED